jgi:acid phosphatase type 7
MTAAITMALAAPMLGVLGDPPASAAALVFNPDADAKVQHANPATNYGTSPALKVDGRIDPVVESYLRFTVAGATTAVTNEPELEVTTRGAGAPVVGAAGDIACESRIPTSTACHQQATANLLADVDAVLPLGDLQYDDATLQEFKAYYDESWGSYLSISHPAVGNHEYYASSTAQGYFDYFGSAAGPRPEGYYSYSVGAWHVISLNANCSQIGGCGPSSPEYTWLQSELGANPTECTLAYWHQPLFATGGGTTAAKPFWNLLFAAHADVVLNGHEHHYERFAPQRPNGVASRRGIREFVVGTGGKSLGGFGAEAPSPTSEVRNSTTFGVLKLALHATSYDWRFVPEVGKTFTDAGSAGCV